LSERQAGMTLKSEKSTKDVVEVDEES